MIRNHNEGADRKIPLDLTALLFILLILGLAGSTIFEVVNPAAEAYLSSLLIEETLLPETFTLEWLFTVPGFLIKFMLFPLTVLFALLLMVNKSSGIYRRYKLEELSAKEPELNKRFKVLVNEMEIDTAPIFFWSPKETQEAFVFRGFGQYKICFTKGLLECFKNRTEQLEAVAAHELGHIANKDVTRTEIAESLVKGYFAIWLFIASFQVMSSLGLSLVFQQSNIALDISFAVSFISLGVIFVILNILSRVRQKYADARVVKLGRQEDLQGALSWLASFHAAGGMNNLKGAKRLAFGIEKAPLKMPQLDTIKQWLLAPDPTILERLEAVTNPAVLQRPALSLSLVTGFIVFVITGVLPFSPVTANILAWVLACVLVGTGIVPAVRQSDIWQGIKLYIPHILLCSFGFFLGHTLSSLTEHLAASMPVPADIAANVLKIEGIVPPNLNLFSAAAVEAWQDTIFFMPGLLLGLLIVTAGWPALDVLVGKLSLFTNNPLLSRGIYSISGLFFVGVFVLSSSSTFLGASYFAEAYRTQVLGLAPNPGYGGHEAIPHDYIPPEIIDSTLNSAEKLYQQSITSNPDFMWPYIQLAQIYILRGEHDNAVALLSRVNLQNKQSSVVYTIRGIAHNAAGHREKAIDDYSAAMKLDPDNFAACTLRADLFFNTGQYEQAITDLSQIISLQPDNQSAYVMRASSYSSLGKYEKALSDYKMAISLIGNEKLTYSSPPSDFNYQINQYLLIINNTIQYGNELTWYGLGIRILRMNLFNQLVSGETPGEIISSYFAPQFIYLMKGNCYHSMGEYQLAREQWQIAAVSYDGINHDYSSGVAYIYLGEFDKAIEVLSRSINMSPVGNTYLYRGVAFTRAGNIPAALADFAVFLELPPGTSKKEILDKIKFEIPEEDFLLLEAGLNYND